MTVQQETQAASTGNFMTANEKAACKKATTREAPHGQRAVALLALNSGDSQAQAADKSGLTEGQVKYWLAKFRKDSLGIFPAVEEAVSEAVIADEPVAEEAEVIAEAAPETEVKSKKDKKGKKGKKDKKAKKDKKGKKGKKDKKGKKSKK